MGIQHETAKKLLPIIETARKAGKPLTYGTAAEALQRDPTTNARMVAQVCDLLDAAATVAGVPLLALTTVREKSGEFNRDAWKGEPYRDAVLERSREHNFTSQEYKAIAEALNSLERFGGNLAAWRHVRKIFPKAEIVRRIAGQNALVTIDAIEDLEEGIPRRTQVVSFHYERNQRVRNDVLRRAKGKCEFCDELGFMKPDGSRYLECHHIIALANDGKDLMSNVIALCASHHKEAHFGKDQEKLERKMIEIVKTFNN